MGTESDEAPDNGDANQADEDNRVHPALGGNKGERWPVPATPRGDCGAHGSDSARSGGYVEGADPCTPEHEVVVVQGKKIPLSRTVRPAGIDEHIAIGSGAQSRCILPQAKLYANTDETGNQHRRSDGQQVFIAKTVCAAGNRRIKGGLVDVQRA